MRPAAVRTAASTPDAFAQVAPMFHGARQPDAAAPGVAAVSRGPAVEGIARLTEGTPLTRQAVTKHLRVLEAAGLATAERDGRERRWQVDTRRMAYTRRLLERISAQWVRRVGHAWPGTSR